MEKNVNYIQSERKIQLETQKFDRMKLNWDEFEMMSGVKNL